jgi:hypothetical protein
VFMSAREGTVFPAISQDPATFSLVVPPVCVVLFRTACAQTKTQDFHV